MRKVPAFFLIALLGVACRDGSSGGTDGGGTGTGGGATGTGGGGTGTGGGGTGGGTGGAGGGAAGTGAPDGGAAGSAAGSDGGMSDQTGAGGQRTDGGVDGGVIGTGPCSAFSACGGDILGTWKVDQGCAAQRSSPPGTCGETLDLSKVTFGLMMTFSADRMLTLSDRASGLVTLDVPKICLPDTGMTTSCSDAQIPYAYGGRIVVGGGEITTLTSCRDTAAVCSCTYNLTATPVTVMVRFTVSGSTLILDNTQPATATYEYCATATELRMRKVGDGGAAGSVSVFLKQ